MSTTDNASMRTIYRANMKAISLVPSFIIKKKRRVCGSITHWRLQYECVYVCLSVIHTHDDHADDENDPTAEHFSLGCGA